MKSLLIVSQPKSMSSVTFSICSKALPNLTNPLQKEAAGEILNDDWSKECLGIKRYTKQEYDKVAAILDKYKKGYVIKDVVQTPAVYRYIQENPDSFNVLIAQRRIEDVAYFMWKRGWTSTIHSLGIPGQHVQNRITLVLHCAALLHLRHNYINPIKAPRVVYKDSLTNPNSIFDKLERLGYSPKRFNYISPSFKERRERTLKERETPLYKQIEQIFRQLRNEL